MSAKAAPLSSPAPPAPPRQNHLAIWTVAIALAAICVALASRNLHRLDGMGLPAESLELVHKHPWRILVIEGALLASLISFVLYRRRAFARVPPALPSAHRDADDHAYAPLSWVTKGRIAFGDAFLDRDGLYLVAYGDESAAEAAASKMGAPGAGAPLVGGGALRERHAERLRLIEAARSALAGVPLADRVMSRVGGARFARDEVTDFKYGKWLGSKLITTRGTIIVQDITPSDAAAIVHWIASRRL